jgi:hypothetical protein
MRYRKSTQSALIGIGLVALASIVAMLLHQIVSDESAFWTAMLAVATGILGGIAWYQIGEIKRQQQGWETLRMCNAYDLDPTLHKAACEIRRVISGGVDIRDAEVEIKTRLNYFEAIAIGISQGFYDPKIVREHLGGILKDHVELYLKPPYLETLKFDGHFEGIKSLVETWYPEARSTKS